ncbi:hypothetical protein [Streptomyces sp. NPDC017260]|uniref:hypothetical protein n=1 Tax=unclassified Streptomyces TaxID=2593676 RepID=UPI00378EF4AA
MDERELRERRERIAAFVRGWEDAGRPESLYSVGAMSRAMAKAMNLVESTARKYLRDAIDAGVLVEVKHLGRSLQFPWPTEELAKGAPERFVQGSVNRGRFWVTEDHQLGPAMTKITFVFTPERVKQVMDEAREADARKATERKQREEERLRRMAAEDAAEAAVFAKHYPELTRLLGVLHERVQEPERIGQGVQMYAEEHPRAGVLATVKITVRRPEALAKLAAILRDGLGTAVGDGQEEDKGE